MLVTAGLIVILVALSFLRKWRGTIYLEIATHVALIAWLFFWDHPLGLKPLIFLFGCSLFVGLGRFKNPKIYWGLAAFAIGILVAARVLPSLEMADLAITFGSWAPPVFASTGLLSAAALPGLSYMIFRWIRFLVDARKLPERPNYTRMIAYSFMTPWFLSGPISSFTEFQNTYEHPYRRDWETLRIAAARATWGATKFFALSSLVYQLTLTRALADGAPLSQMQLVIGLLAYPAYLFLNFSGFTDMMIAAAALLGFGSTENFDRPYLATSVQDFWRRWHISLTELLKDFVYIPLARKLETFGLHSPLAKYFCGSFAVFALMALWHGSTWNYLAFSALQVTALVIERACGVRRRAQELHPFFTTWLRRFYVWIFLAFSFFFFENTPPAIAEILRRLPFVH